VQVKGKSLRGQNGLGERIRSVNEIKKEKRQLLDNREEGGPKFAAKSRFASESIVLGVCAEQGTSRKARRK